MEAKELNSKFQIVKVYFIYFFFYCVIGWLYEVFLEVFVYRWGFSNRGVLFGPYLPVYGVGALLFLIFLNKVKQKKHKVGPVDVTPVLIFLGTMAIATVAELICSYILEFTIGDWMWHYEDRFPINFQGRIALNPSVRFGLGGLVFLYILQPFFEKFTSHCSSKTITILFCLLSGIMLIDFVVTIILK